MATQKYTKDFQSLSFTMHKPPVIITKFTIEIKIYNAFKQNRKQKTININVSYKQNLAYTRLTYILAHAQCLDTAATSIH